MRTTHIFASLLAITALTATAHAQTSLVEVDDGAMVTALGADADTVDDWDVFLGDGTEVGEVEEVLGTDRSTPTALAIDFEGNAGYADRDVAVPLDRFTRTDGRLILNADPAAVQAMPGWDD